MLYVLIFIFYSQRNDFIYFCTSKVLEKKWKVEVNYKSATSVITTTVHIVPDDKQQYELPELSPKHRMDFSEEGKRQTVTEMKKCDVLYNEEFKKFRYIYIIFCIYTFLPHPCTCTFFLFKRNQYLECLLKKIGRQMDAHGKMTLTKICSIFQNLLQVKVVDGLYFYLNEKSSHLCWCFILNFAFVDIIS